MKGLPNKVKLRINNRVARLLKDVKGRKVGGAVIAPSDAQKRMVDLLRSHRAKFQRSRRIT